MNSHSVYVLVEIARRASDRRRVMMLRARAIRFNHIDQIWRLHAAGDPIPPDLAAKVCPVFRSITGIIKSHSRNWRASRAPAFRGKGLNENG